MNEIFSSTVLAGETALVTGASRGIGALIARALADAGATVVGTATSAAGAEAISGALAGAGRGIVLDVADDGSVRAAIDDVQGREGAPTIVVNNAGITRDNLLMRMKAEEWDDVIATNLSGVYRVSKACLKGMMKARKGRIINIASAHSLVASPFKTAYVSAKHGLAGFTKVVALEVATFGITINCISPGYVWMPLVEKQLPDQMKTRNMTREQVIDVLLAAQPTKQFITVDQIGALALYLCSDAAAPITGANISIDGGFTAQ